jgi:hypothetical protein
MSQKEAYDQEKAAVHEAGHLVVALHVFASNFISIRHLKAQIYRVPGGTRSGCTWNGDFVVHGLDLLPPEERAKIGVAGVVAVTRWRGTSVQDLDFKNPDTMSLRDWDTCGCEPGESSEALMRAADAVFASLDPASDYWADVLKEARRLIAAQHQPTE